MANEHPANNEPEKLAPGGRRIDPATGIETVGHEWDGIEELDSPMPRWWLWTLYATIVWAVIYAVLYPAWPMLERASEGALGWSSRGQLAQEMQLADEGRAELRAQLAGIPIEQLSENGPLMAQAVAGGSAAFKVNCVQCHGSGAAGGDIYPNLNDDDWLWGGDLIAIENTVTHGIREPNDAQTRVGAMPAFAGAFDRPQIDALVDHVLSLSGKADANAVGAQIYDGNCALCHGGSGEGQRALGAPRLNDAIWLYGSSREELAQQISAPRLGMMPAWGERLDPVTVKMLAAYVHSLGGGEDLVEVAADPAPPEPAIEPAIEADEQS